MTLSHIVIALGTVELLSLLVVLAAFVARRRAVPHLHIPPRAEPARSDAQEAA